MKEGIVFSKDCLFQKRGVVDRGLWCGWTWHLMHSKRSLLIPFVSIKLPICAYTLNTFLFGKSLIQCSTRFCQNHLDRFNAFYRRLVILKFLSLIPLTLQWFQSFSLRAHPTFILRLHIIDVNYCIFLWRQSVPLFACLLTQKYNLVYVVILRSTFLIRHLLSPLSPRFMQTCKLLLLLHLYIIVWHSRTNPLGVRVSWREHQVLIYPLFCQDCMIFLSGVVFQAYLSCIHF